MDELTQLKNKIQKLEDKLANLESGVNIPYSLMQKLSEYGFIREVGPRIITYTNPAGKDLYSTFIEFSGGIRSVSVQEQGYYLPVDSVGVSTDTLNIKNHGISNDTQVQVATTDTPPGGLSIQLIYYVVGATTDALKLSATLGGTAINITSVGSGLHYLTAV